MVGGDENLRRDLQGWRYLRAVEERDADAVAAFWDEAGRDPELARVLAEIDEGLIDEAGRPAALPSRRRWFRHAIPAAAGVAGVASGLLFGAGRAGASAAELRAQLGEASDVLGELGRAAGYGAESGLDYAKARKIVEELQAEGLLAPITFHGGGDDPRRPDVLVSGRDQLLVGGVLHPARIESVTVAWQAGEPAEVVYPKKGEKVAPGRVSFQARRTFPLEGQLLVVRVAVKPFAKDEELLARLGYGKAHFAAEARFLATEMGIVVAPQDGVWDDPARRLAEMVVRAGGTVKLHLPGGKTVEVSSPRELPTRITIQLVALPPVKRIGDAFAKRAAEVNLQGFQAAGTSIGDEGAEHLARIKGLRWLYLGGTRVTDKGLASLKSLRGLTNLDVGLTAVTDAGLPHLAGLASLVELRLEGTAITDAEVKSLAGLRAMRKLNLASTEVSDAGLASLREMRSLRELRLEGTRVTAAGAKELKAHLPDCAITR